MQVLIICVFSDHFCVPVRRIKRVMSARGRILLGTCLESMKSSMGLLLGVKKDAVVLFI